MEEKRSYLSVSEILSKAFYISKNNITEILKVIGIFILPTMVILIGTIFAIALSSFLKISYSYSYSYFDRDIPFIGIGTILIILLLTTLASLIMMYANAVIIKLLDDANKGKEVSWRSANIYVWQRKWSIIGLNILIYLMLLAAMVSLILVTVLLAFLTIGIGLIILIPLFIAIVVIMRPFVFLFNSMLIVRDLTITESIGETFRLFKKGYFWTTIGKLAAISGIIIGFGIVLTIGNIIIPILGMILALIGQFLIQAYTRAYLNILVWDRNEEVEILIDPIL
ncbi:hypothetical protein ACH36K_01695 [Clostridium sp. MB05]